ncbi:MAG: aldehyde reductase [Anaerolineae bacterium]|nr:aldehyde reductase [Anaerolineae bacterium]
MHCIVQLLEQGYRVRGTLRTPSRAAGLREAFARHVDAADRLDFVTADLMRDDGWAEAVAGCTYVMHIASPVPRKLPRHENDLIIPAREGTRRVLQAAADAQVKRVVMTSSVAAVCYGHDSDSGRVFDETDWSDTSQDIGPYPKSKTLAERDAWEFVENHPALELAVINPAMVLGPLLDARYTTSIEIVLKLMNRDAPGCPNIGWSFVDVRDVAAAHLAAMTIPEATGQRFICSHEFAWLQDIARILHDHFAHRGFNIPRRKLPDIVLRFFALFDETARLSIDYLGARTDYSNARITSVLNWQPHSLPEMVIATGESLIEHGIVQASR